MGNLGFPIRPALGAADAASPTAVGAPAPATPARDGVYLSWVRLQGAEECPDALRIADDVSRRLGWNPFQGKPVQYIEAEIRREESWWRVEIFLRDASSRARGSRTVVSRAPTCDTLASVAGLAIAIIIDPEVLTRPAATPDVVPSPGGNRDLPIVVRSPGIGRLGLLGVGTLGLLPGAAAGVGLWGEIGISGRLALSLGATFLPEVRHTGPVGDFAYGMTWTQLGLSCELVSRPRWTLSASAAMLLGAIHAVVYSPAPAHPGQRLYLAVTAGMQLFVGLGGRWEASLSVDGIVPLARPRFDVIYAGTEVRAYRQPAVAGTAGLGLVYRFR